MLVDKLFGFGIPSYTTTLYTPLPITAEISLPIAKQLPQQIGRIFGMAIYCDGKTPDNKDLITTADAGNLYISLKDGATDFFQDVRLTDLLTVFNGAPSPRPYSYLPVNIPSGFDLSTSAYFNPTGIVAGANSKTIALKLWYVSTVTYDRLIKNKLVMQNGERPMTSNV